VSVLRQLLYGSHVTTFVTSGMAGKCGIHCSNSGEHIDQKLVVGVAQHFTKLFASRLVGLARTAGTICS